MGRYRRASRVDDGCDGAFFSLLLVGFTRDVVGLFVGFMRWIFMKENAKQGSRGCNRGECAMGYLSRGE